LRGREKKNKNKKKRTRKRRGKYCRRRIEVKKGG